MVLLEGGSLVAPATGLPLSDLVKHLLLLLIQVLLLGGVGVDCALFHAKDVVEGEVGGVVGHGRAEVVRDLDVLHGQSGPWRDTIVLEPIRPRIGIFYGSDAVVIAADGDRVGVLDVQVHGVLYHQQRRNLLIVEAGAELVSLLHLDELILLGQLELRIHQIP
eukprot:CAMPEP_0170548458 /NCGR_PEP_ID=MMETSP0211-20121228/6787_1 /TAXON_ID=311385 /ORGANISM="Pseudokeronopsis sp., Strain OXSARD2" /LENGTH=162 /DNA_ID=CAMNT_0010854039 /DNA_START=688 /DNA_END=1176 /DNA_ORIENTATION=+